MHCSSSYQRLSPCANTYPGRRSLSHCFHFRTAASPCFVIAKVACSVRQSLHGVLRMVLSLAWLSHLSLEIPASPARRVSGCQRFVLSAISIALLVCQAIPLGDNARRDAR